MEPMFQLEGSCLTIALPKELDHPVSEAIRKESDRIIADTYIHGIILDFRDTEFMDSSGIGLIMGRYKALGMRRGCVGAVNVNSHVNKLLHLSGIHKYVEIRKNGDQEGSI